MSDKALVQTLGSVQFTKPEVESLIHCLRRKLLSLPYTNDVDIVKERKTLNLLVTKFNNCFIPNP